MKVRLASTADAEHVLALIRENPKLPQWRREALAIAANDREEASDSVRRLLLAEENGRVLGFTQVAVLLGEAELESMAVRADRRRQGVGRLLLEQAMASAREAGADVFRLEVRASNGAAQRLYRAAGMTVVGRRGSYYRDPVEDALLLQLSWTDAC